MIRKQHSHLANLDKIRIMGDFPLLLNQGCLNLAVEEIFGHYRVSSRDPVS